MADDYSFPADEYVLVGKITKAHGLQGEVKIYPFSEEPVNLTHYKDLVLVDKRANRTLPLKVVKSRVQGKIAVVQFATIDDRTKAEDIEGAGVLLARDNLLEVSDDEFYWQDYQGKLVVDLDGTNIGRVDHLFSNGAQDVLVVKNNGDEILIPVTKEIVIKESGGNLVVDLPPGLLDLNNGAD